jgi:peptidyl-prolyl cis-trans isomerase SurA
MATQDRERALRLVKRGDEQLAEGNVAAARLFYERAADAGLAQGAMALARTFDADELARLGRRDIHADPKQAQRWYERAQQLGDAEERLRRTGANARIASAANVPPSAGAEPAAPKDSPSAKADRQSVPNKTEQAVVVLVNDAPITAHEIQQRANFLALQAGSGGMTPELKAKVEARWAQIIKDPKLNERLQALMQEKKFASQEQAQAVQKDFVMKLQRDMIEQLQRESRAAMMPKLRKEAQEELIDERLKLQEAKRGGIEITDEDVRRMLKALSDRNKMTEDQFVQHLKGMGVDISTMKERTRAQAAWREVVRRKFSSQIAITSRDVDRMISATASQAGADTVELQVQKILLPTPGKIDQLALAKRYAEADGLRQRIDGCKAMAGLAREANARFEDMKYIKPSTISEPTRSMLLNARDGDVLPPMAAPAGIEIYAICGRRSIKADEKERERAQEELAQKEFEIMAKRQLRDLRQDARIIFP